MMIILDTGEFFKMTTQHDHARFSGELATQLKDNLFINTNYRDTVILSITEHDRAWIRLDQVPIWNDQQKIPFSFTDYPLLPKITMYKKGIDEVENMNQYAALLCSIHYTSFQDIRQSNQKDCIDYIKNELQRQQQIKSKLPHFNDKVVTQHYRLLRFLDELSLYVCLNQAGVTKNEEHPWFVNGFGTLIDDQRYYAEWKSRSEIKITPFPFKTEFEITLKTKYVPKDLREKIGINSAYHDTGYTFSTLRIVG
ncbi:DUF3891 family protein [Gracilibacillus salitolerans]|uniref:DUF3891 family protein n=2 Tax=Gracilibacillus salitolerans TaxID=2663022 RepID=A0A5Q2TIJ9_9BACI|nr:DUF3891 family protein [Gracilibacillus salitolerans]